MILQKYTKYNLDRIFKIYNDATMAVFLALCGIVLLLNTLALYFMDAPLVMPALSLSGAIFLGVASYSCTKAVYDKIKNDQFFLI